MQTNKEPEMPGEAHNIDKESRTAIANVKKFGLALLAKVEEVRRSETGERLYASEDLLDADAFWRHVLQSEDTFKEVTSQKIASKKDPEEHFYEVSRRSNGGTRSALQNLERRIRPPAEGAVRRAVLRLDAATTGK